MRIFINGGLHLIVRWIAGGDKVDKLISLWNRLVEYQSHLTTALYKVIRVIKSY